MNDFCDYINILIGLALPGAPPPPRPAAAAQAAPGPWVAPAPRRCRGRCPAPGAGEGRAPQLSSPRRAAPRRSVPHRSVRRRSAAAAARPLPAPRRSVTPRRAVRERLLRPAPPRPAHSCAGSRDTHTYTPPPTAERRGSCRAGAAAELGSCPLPPASNGAAGANPPAGAEAQPPKIAFLSGGSDAVRCKTATGALRVVRFTSKPGRLLGLLS